MDFCRLENWIESKEQPPKRLYTMALSCHHIFLVIWSVIFGRIKNKRRGREALGDSTVAGLAALELENTAPS